MVQVNVINLADNFVNYPKISDSAVIKIKPWYNESWNYWKNDLNYTLSFADGSIKQAEKNKSESLELLQLQGSSDKLILGKNSLKPTQKFSDYTGVVTHYSYRFKPSRFFINR